MKLTFLMLALFVVSCAMGKKLRLQQFDYEIGKEARLTVESIRRLDDKIVIKVLGISIGEEIVALKKEEIFCGVGDQTFTSTTVSGVSEDIFELPKTKFQEFTVTCHNETPVRNDEAPFILFENIYVSSDQSDVILDSNIKIKIK